MHRFASLLLEAALVRGEKGTARARGLRKQSTRAERKIWSAVRDRRLAGFKFRRQHPVGGYVLDLYCEEARLAVELDGGGHAEPEQARHDQLRDQHLSSLGIRMLRFWNHQAMNSTDEVLSVILRALEGRRGGEIPSPRPSPRGEGATAQEPVK